MILDLIITNKKSYWAITFSDEQQRKRKLQVVACCINAFLYTTSAFHRPGDEIIYSLLIMVLIVTLIAILSQISVWKSNKMLRVTEFGITYHGWDWRKHAWGGYYPWFSCSQLVLLLKQSTDKKVELRVEIQETKDITHSFDIGIVDFEVISNLLRRIIEWTHHTPVMHQNPITSINDFTYNLDF